MAEKEKKKVVPIVIDGFEINDQKLTYHKLQQFALTLYEKLLVQRRERNFLMMERDKLRTILENTRHEIMVAEESVRNTEREIDKVEETYRREKKEVEEEVKWLHYKHGTDLAELKLWENKALEAHVEKELEEELELLQEKRKQKEEIQEQERMLMEGMEAIKSYHQRDLEELMRIQDELQIQNEIDAKRKFIDTVERITLKHEMEMSEIEERKNTHLVELKQIHKTRLEETKSHFNSITAENLAVISNLKQSIDTMTKNKTIVSGEVKNLKRENDKLSDSLDKLKAETRNLNRQVVNYEKDLLSLKNNKRMLKQTIKETKENKKQSVEAMNLLKNVALEMQGSLDTSCSNSLMGFKNIASAKRKRLEGLIEILLDDLMKKQNIISAISADPDVGQALKELRFEFWDPKTLTYEFALVCKAFDELLQTLNEKLVEFCVSERDLGSQPINLDHLGYGPAALISKQ
ncbi:dynein regulatory complex subunit 4-like [Homalodisca vitripennis]|uniref:dynein regulatory complex subunit 4-like n=1 Tax=Homalodisca vitripennis TaxID=197043 RepID=UPI001EEB305E|nr:dynein regulatory complex subunit 4-like [Homalodisca vitripennis]KAG8305010.1 Dynein regulatory complex subunit 4 [Homalodisca vitripennis]KAG8320075.1 Dynein regulatory complex subunit 4 [Homalodisca vitripennis]